MRAETLSFGSERGFGRNGRTVPYLVQHFAVARPNRLPPSIRIPVTPANRALLRELRAAEMAAWQTSRRRFEPEQPTREAA